MGAGKPENGQYWVTAWTSRQTWHRTTQAHYDGPQMGGKKKAQVVQMLKRPNERGEHPSRQQKSGLIRLRQFDV